MKKYFQGSQKLQKKCHFQKMTNRLNWYHLRCIELRFAPKKPTGVAEIA